MKIVNIAKDFSEVPAGRFTTDGDFSGQRFREEILLPSLGTGDQVEIDIDGTAGYGSSFLEEAFGGLVRRGSCSRDELHRRLIIRTQDPSFSMYRAAIWRYIDHAARATVAAV
jgi:hypothetical protein